MGLPTSKEAPGEGPIEQAPVFDFGDEWRLVEPVRRVARFNIPVNARVVVVTGPESDLLRLEGRRTWHFPIRKDGDLARLDPDDWTVPIHQLESLRLQGADYLVVPASGYWWMERHTQLKEYVQRRFHLAVNVPHVCSIWELRGARPEARAYRPPDRLPLPPRHLIWLVAGVYRPREFYEEGVLGADCIRAALMRHGADMNDLGAVLDFACGCGRVMRHWKWLKPELHGTDYNPYLVEWCRENLPFAEFQVNELTPGLGYEDDSFDLVYAISAFTHFDEGLQRPWMAELTRVTKPGGFILLTLHGRSRLADVGPDDVARFEAGELVVLGGDIAGSNACVAYHPEKYVRETLAGPLEVLEHVPDGAEDAKQDLALFRKPEASGAGSTKRRRRRSK